MVLLIHLTQQTKTACNYGGHLLFTSVVSLDKKPFLNVRDGGKKQYCGQETTKRTI